jgi:hypothetical protein
LVAPGDVCWEAIPCPKASSAALVKPGDTCLASPEPNDWSAGLVEPGLLLFVGIARP